MGSLIFSLLLLVGDFTPQILFEVPIEDQGEVVGFPLLVQSNASSYAIADLSRQFWLVGFDGGQVSLAAQPGSGPGCITSRVLNVVPNENTWSLILNSGFSTLFLDQTSKILSTERNADPLFWCKGEAKLLLHPSGWEPRLLWSAASQTKSFPFYEGKKIVALSLQTCDLGPQTLIYTAKGVDEIFYVRLNRLTSAVSRGSSKIVDPRNADLVERLPPPKSDHIRLLGFLQGVHAHPKLGWIFTEFTTSEAFRIVRVLHPDGTWSLPAKVQMPVAEELSHFVYQNGARWTALGDGKMVVMDIPNLAEALKETP